MNAPLRIGLVASHEVDLIWPVIAEQMQHACEKSDQDARYKLNAGDLWQMCRSGNGFLIIGYDDPTKPLMASLLVLRVIAWHFALDKKASFG